MSTMTESLDLTGETTRLQSVVPDKTAAAPRGMLLQFIIGNHDIDIKLLNNIPISALRFEVVFRKKFNYKAPDLSERIQNLNSYINFQDNVITFVLLDIDGKGITPGDGTILKIPIEADQDFEISGAYASTRTSGILEIEHTVSKNALGEETLILEQNDPNPFSGRTRLDFRIPVEADAKLMIYDVGGALIRTLVDSRLPAGMHSADWDGRDDSGTPTESGIYFYKLYAGVYSVTKKMVYLK